MGVRDDQGRLLHLEGFISDISERREVVDALRDREQMLSGLVESLPGAVYRTPMEAPLDATWFMSDGCMEPAPLTSAELFRGPPTWAVLHRPRRRSDGVRPTSSAIGPLAEMTMRPSTASRTKTAPRAGSCTAPSSWRDDKGTPREIIGLLIHITARRETEQALREA